MPELPEVETVMRGLAPALLKRRLEEVEVRRFDLRRPVDPDFAEVVKGQAVNRLSRRGKYILAHLTDGTVVVLHLGMSGRVLIVPADDLIYQEQKHDHVVLTTDEGVKVIYNDARRFGMLFLTDEQNWHRHEAFSSMGPEPLGNDFHGPGFFERLQKRAGPIKTALLDQKLVAGVGNIYACEALFDAGIHPEKPAKELSSGQAEDLCAAIKGVLLRAIEAGGSSLKDHKQTDGTLGYFQHQFRVYDREGQPCPRTSCSEKPCGGKAGNVIKRITQSGRSTFYCPSCQR